MGSQPDVFAERWGVSACSDCGSTIALGEYSRAGAQPVCSSCLAKPAVPAVRVVYRDSIPVRDFARRWAADRFARRDAA